MEKWGSKIWIFLHAFSVKIKDNTFNENKLMILEFIELIFNNLPCIICKKEYVFRQSLYNHKKNVS